MTPHGLAARIRIGLLAGFVGAVTIWIYEFVVLFWLLRQTTALGVVQHTALLVFGPHVLATPVFAFVAGFLIHCLTAMVWGVTFALAWPAVSRRGIEASLAALVFGAIAWVVMHVVVLAWLSPDPPVYTVYSVINGLMSHMVAFAVPLALTVQHLEARAGEARRLSEASRALSETCG